MLWGQPRARFRRQAVSVVLAVLASAVGSVAPAQAIKDDVGEPSGNCSFATYNSFRLDASFPVTGVPAANSSVKVDASNARIVAAKTTGTSPCDPLTFSISSFQWNVEAPPGQNATIANGTTLAPTVTLGGPGAYRVLLTACANKCTLRVGGKTKIVGPFAQGPRLDVPTTGPPRPDLIPTVPALPGPNPAPPSFGLAERAAKCSLGGGITDPEWVTTQRFGGANDYRHLEGPVTWSRMADLDNFMNHFGRGGAGEDFEWKVTPDPPYAGLAQPGEAEKGGWKTEWENGSFPALFRPTPGDPTNPARPADRTSTYGFWIFDCGHYPFKTEIHPPVGVMTQRPRPIQIPPTYRAPGFPNGFGSNVWVPGIEADIWFNRRSGGAGSCLPAALHQPAPNSPKPLFCITQPHPVNRTFTFNVYIPKSPQQLAQERGQNAPPVQLFTNVQKLSAGQGGPDPVVVQKQLGGVTYLEVTVDLSALRDNQYGRRLSIAWAYPSPDNWGAARWRIGLKSLRVIDDAEPPFDDGDWRLYFNTNNRDQEWTELFSCEGCVDDDSTYSLGISGTGHTAGAGTKPGRARGLGPDPVVFPGQDILVHSTGYDDEILGDDVGTVQEWVPQLSGDYDSASSVNGGSYRLRYSIRPVGSVGAATLTPEAAAQLNAYNGGGVNCNSPVILRAFAAQQRAAPECVPGGTVSTLGDNPVVRLESLPAFETQGDERSEFSLIDASASRLKKEFRAAKGRDRRDLIKQINEALKDLPNRLEGDARELVATLDQALPTSAVRQAVPRGVRRSIDRRRR